MRPADLASPAPLTLLWDAKVGPPKEGPTACECARVEGSRGGSDVHEEEERRERAGRRAERAHRRRRG